MESDLLTRDPDQLPAVLKVPELARYLRMPTSRTYALVDEGRIPSIRFGRSIRIPRAAIIDLLKAGTRRGEE